MKWTTGARRPLAALAWRVCATPGRARLALRSSGLSYAVVFGECPDDRMEDLQTDEIELCTEEDDNVYSDSNAGTPLVDEGITQYWTTSGAGADGADPLPYTTAVILVVDTDNNVIVIAGTGGIPTSVSYDGVNDRFNIVTDPGDPVPASLDEFEKALAADADGNDTLSATVGGDRAINIFTLNVVDDA